MFSLIVLKLFFTIFKNRGLKKLVQLAYFIFHKNNRKSLTIPDLVIIKRLLNYFFRKLQRIFGALQNILFELELTQTCTRTEPEVIQN